MPNLNKVMLMGNLTRDPEIRHTPKGTAVAELSLAINRTWRDEQGNKQEDTTFVEVTLWGRTAELAGQYLAKGKPVYIEGRLQLDTWDDKATGQKRTKMKIVGETMQFLQSGGDRGDRGGQGEQQQSSRSYQRQQQNTAQQSAPSAEDFDDDIPF